MNNIRLMAIDWGTTVARAYAMDREGRVVRSVRGDFGVQKIAHGDFASALAELRNHDMRDVPVLACGMIGSRQGWVEAPYCVCPAGFDDIAGKLTAVPDALFSIVPGLVCHDDDVPDVMRGEETQIIGALSPDSRERRVVVLPGTHSKWALVEAERITTFATFMTGELYAVLREHSILGRLADAGDDLVALERGLRRSLRTAATLSHDLFSTRTLALTGSLAAHSVGDYLSGLLLGAELAGARAWLARHDASDAEVTLVGDEALCERYARALAMIGKVASHASADAAARGLWRIACHAGIVK